MSGRVILVGAGPGAADLLTLRGAEALRGADAVLYDELAAHELLDLAPPAALRIDVGKRGHDPPTLDQENINALLVKLAREGKTVVRLKGGDPFVFGRGAEEAGACADAGIPCEVVPGVSAALAAPALAGIPVTDRRYAASFAVVTGHKDPTRASRELRWDALAEAADTLVVLMGMRNLETILDEIGRVRPPDTPAAAIMWAGTPRQRTVEAPLGKLAQRVREAGVGTPATLVVGDVVRLRHQLAAPAELPLASRKVLVTRGDEQGAVLVAALERAGAEAVHLPMLRFEPAEDPAALDACLERLGDYDALVLASANAARFLAERARVRGVSLDALRGMVLCIGPASAAAARAAGLRVDRTPEGRRDAQGLLDELSRWIDPAGKRFLLPQSQIGRALLPDGLRGAGAQVDAPVAYRTLPPEPDAPQAEALRRRLARGLDAVTFTSPSAVRNCLGLLDAESQQALSRCVLVAVGPTTAAALREAGLEPDVVPEEAGVEELVEALVAHEAARPGAAEEEQGEPA
ncbi:MAG: uroporphyrinogen-III C-methyltransferase [Deltaproteobacteria bacterium]|nr:uroporphyrinogen-III C-methyltransferase [Deltaproteobacteria bacterium]